MKNTSDKKGPGRLIIFSDLDGSLLNHGDYSWEAARPALDKIREQGIPLVICTSKTRLEVEFIQKEIGIAGPFIVENGGGIFFPPEYSSIPVGSAAIIDNYRCIPLGVSYARVRSFIEEAGKEFSIRGFGDMEIEEVVARTGLPMEMAFLAKERGFTEPFVLEHEEELDTLNKTANLKGFMITRGGRFFHCMGYGNDKGDAVRRVREIFSRHWQKSVLSIGFGDSPNDFPLLKAVDIPVLIPHEDGSFEELELPGLFRAPYPGSRGWNEAALKIIADTPAKKRRTRKASQS
jgi:mannosyl-3-phosphoglycerate phosphatase